MHPVFDWALMMCDSVGVVGWVCQSIVPLGSWEDRSPRKLCGVASILFWLCKQFPIPEVMFAFSRPFVIVPMPYLIPAHSCSLYPSHAMWEGSHPLVILLIHSSILSWTTVQCSSFPPSGLSQTLKVFLSVVSFSKSMELQVPSGFGIVISIS